MNDYNQIKSFLMSVNKAAVRKDAQIRMSMEDAIKLQTELSLLLLELKDTNKTPETVIFDGGKFNARI
jgi:hypothetical protein